MSINGDMHAIGNTQHKFIDPDSNHNNTTTSSSKLKLLSCRQISFMHQNQRFPHIELSTRKYSCRRTSMTVMPNQSFQRRHQSLRFTSKQYVEIDNIHIQIARRLPVGHLEHLVQVLRLDRTSLTQGLVQLQSHF